jgi:hypothetical protein
MPKSVRKRRTFFAVTHKGFFWRRMKKRRRGTEREHRRKTSWSGEIPGAAALINADIVAKLAEARSIRMIPILYPNKTVEAEALKDLRTC